MKREEMTNVWVSKQTNGLIKAMKEKDPSLTSEDVVSQAMQSMICERQAS